MFVTIPKNCLWSGWQFKDLSLPSILNCQGCFDNLKANYFWHQSFVLPQERPVSALKWRKACFLTGASLALVSFFCTGTSLLRISLCWISLFHDLYHQKYSLKTLNELLLSKILYPQGEMRTVFKCWDLVIGTPRPGTGVEIQELGKDYKKLHQWYISKDNCMYFRAVLCVSHSSSLFIKLM